VLPIQVAIYKYHTPLNTYSTVHMYCTTALTPNTSYCSAFRARHSAAPPFHGNLGGNRRDCNRNLAAPNGDRFGCARQKIRPRVASLETFLPFFWKCFLYFLCKIWNWLIRNCLRFIYRCFTHTTYIILLHGQINWSIFRVPLNQPVVWRHQQDYKLLYHFQPF